MSTSPSSAEPDSTAGTPKPVRVLIAEDDHDIRVGLRQLLECSGYVVDSVSTGADLLGYLSSWILSDSSRREPPADIIVTDVRMPGFNGLNIVEGLRANGFQQPVVVMTAFGDEAMRERVARMGRAALIDKPFDPAMLERLLASLVNREG